MLKSKGLLKTNLIKKFSEKLTPLGGQRGNIKPQTTKQTTQSQYDIHLHKTFIPFLKDFEKCYNSINKSIYINNMTQMVRNKLDYIEGEINRLNNRVDERIGTNSHIVSGEVAIPKTLFGLTSIKDTENHIKSLPTNVSNDIKFKLELLNHYANLNIDKAFEYYYENLYKTSFEADEFFVNFVRKCFQYDKAEYVKPS
jgi:hypothetical protein